MEKIMATLVEPIRIMATMEGLMSRRRTAEEDVLLYVLADLIEKFESRTYADLGPDPTPAETIRFLMEQNGLTQKDLWEMLGGKSHTSEILNGKRKVGIRQATSLGKRFKISPSAFVRFA